MTTLSPHLYSPHLAWAWHKAGAKHEFSNGCPACFSVRSKFERQGFSQIHCCWHMTSYLIHEYSVNVGGLSNEALYATWMETSSGHNRHTQKHMLQSFHREAHSLADNRRLWWESRTRRMRTNAMETEGGINRGEWREGWECGKLKLWRKVP